MEILATHIGADFDGFAAMWVARRLHPGARLFFPGSREESLRRMIAERRLDFDELKKKDVEPAEVRRLILCDIRQRDRIGVLAEWLEENPAIEVFAYDHHPDSAADLPTAGGIVDPEAGSTSTLIVEECRRRGIEPSPEEAELLLMGLYEDTGSLTYATTGPRDLRAAAWLLELGADLAPVRRFIARALDPQHIAVLAEMTRRLEVHPIHGHRVGVVEVELGEYVEELAPLVSRCLDLFELAVLFGIFGEEEHVTVIARGDLAGFDLGETLAELAGGGGHPTAAAARLKGVTSLEVRERLLAYLERRLPPAARARELMIAPFFSLAADVTVGEAKAGLNARRVNAAPVCDPGTGRVVGLVSRQVLDAALQHGFAERPVETVMSADLVWVAPEAPAEGIGELMLSRHPRLVLVGEEETGKPLGIVTRMQLLRHLHGRVTGVGESLDRRAEQQRGRREQVGHLLERRVTPAVAARIAAIAAVAQRRSVAAYLVGGFVRDLLLERHDRDLRDLDVVVEGDGPEFAALLAAELGGRSRVHAAFMTAVVTDSEGFEIDVATARSESYRSPAALPEVETSALRQDLYRRDFTINTLAIRLGPTAAPELIDYFGARRDLKDKTLRVLHSLSFIDDPTRILRAVRLELRLGLRISPETARLAEIAVAEGVFGRLSGARLRDELALLLDDPAHALPGLERLEELGVLRAIHPRLGLSEETRGALDRARAACDWYLLEGLSDPPLTVWRLLLLTLAAGLGRAEREQLADRLMLMGENRRLVETGRERLSEVVPALEPAETVSAHRVVEALETLSGEEILAVMADADEALRAWVRRYLGELRGVALVIRGADLVAAGVAPGPVVGEALRATRRARIDGAIGPAEELSFALAHAEGLGSRATAVGGTVS